MCKILVIDDEAAIVDIVQQALDMYGHNVETATNGREGIAKFDSDCFDLVITDICMPEIDGNGVVQYIRGSGKKYIPVIGISGTAWAVKDNTFDTVLEKPFPIKTLIDSVQRLLPTHQDIATA
jgi:two-component system response regulator VanR